MQLEKVDKIFLGLTLALVIGGGIVFSSAALGVLLENEAKFWGVIFNQFVLGLLGGVAVMLFFSQIDYKLYKKYALLILLLAVVVTLFVYVPGIGFEHNGAKRWIHLGGVSFQPSEFLKIAYVIYLAAWFSWAKEKVKNYKYGIIPLVVLSAIVGAILLNEPDLGTFLVILASGLSIFFVAGGRKRDLAVLGGVIVVGVIVLAMARPYLKDRILTYLDPSRDPQGSSYQLQQSLIAIGSGGIFGRGFGQSIQKFNFLPEPVGDSIFAVYSEEFGFLGAVILILFFVAFALRGLRISARSGDPFGRLLSLGIVILILSQSFINIGSMVGILPLTGVPLVFISHGGTALLFALLGAGIVLNISRKQIT